MAAERRLLLPFEFFPHLNANAGDLARLVTYSRHIERPILAVHDGDGVAVADGLVECSMSRGGAGGPAGPPCPEPAAAAFLARAGLGRRRSKLFCPAWNRSGRGAFTPVTFRVYRPGRRPPLPLASPAPTESRHIPCTEKARP
jgi:hypothetical protein